MDIYDEWEKENPVDEGLGWGQEAWSQQEMPVSSELAERMASRNDAAVIIIARTAGEDRDNTAEKGSYFLRDSEEAMLAAVSAAFVSVPAVVPAPLPLPAQPARTRLSAAAAAKKIL